MPDPATPTPPDPPGSVLDQIIGLLPGLKKGITTTEFWGVVGSLIIAVIGLINPVASAHLTPLIREYAVVIGTSAPIVYGVCRTTLKYLHGKSIVQTLEALPSDLLNQLATQPATVGQVAVIAQSDWQAIDARIHQVAHDTVAAAVRSRRAATTAKADPPKTPPAVVGAPAGPPTTAPWAAGAPATPASPS